ncbi:MAG: hypothetical protein Q8S75_12545 [Nitrospirota bacterium]|nr:hypothetical protein [Nitrospirota bacterium]
MMDPANRAPSGAEDLDEDAAILRDFGETESLDPLLLEHDSLIHPEVIASAAWSPYAYAALLNRLLDQGLADLGGPAARVYLQLIRETYGRGRGQATLSLRELRQSTGLFDASLIRAIASLKARHLIAVGEGTSHTPSTYRVDLSKLMKQLKKDDELPVRRFSVEYRLEDLSPNDKKELVAIERALTPAIRKEIALSVRVQFHELGQSKPDPAEFRQACRYLILTRLFSPMRLRQAYPHWFDETSSV